MPTLVAASLFKSKCLSLLDEVATKGSTIIVTKRGKPVATVCPVKAGKPRSSEGILRGKVHIPDGVLEADTTDLWDCVRGGKETQAF